MGAVPSPTTLDPEAPELLNPTLTVYVLVHYLLFFDIQKEFLVNTLIMYAEEQTILCQLSSDVVYSSLG